MNRSQKADLESNASRLAAEEASHIAENHAVGFIQQFVAELSEVRGQKYILPPADFSEIFHAVRGLVQRAAFDRIFEAKVAAFTKERKIAEAAQRRERKWAAEEMRCRPEVEAPADTGDVLEEQIEQAGGAS
jgi:hypothetical protein